MDAVIHRLKVLGQDGIFGPGDVVAVESNSTDTKGAQYASQLLFVRVTLKADETREVPVVVKVQISGEEREFMGTDIQFANEVIMYEKILPKLRTLERGIHGKMLYGCATAGKHPEEDIIVLEDLRPFGYKVVKTVFVDHQHVSLALKKLGEYHGLSYKLKKQSPNALRELGKELLLAPHSVDGGAFFEGALLRGFKPLIDKHPNGIAKKAHEKLSKLSSGELWKTLRKPEEPFAVITHGDYNVNNVLFRYDDGKVTDIKFIDFATSEYSDPVVDIAFFLYINTSPETRDEHWDEFLRTYWEGVLSVEDSPGFVYEDFLDHFAKRAIWGYLPCSFFLPMMLVPEANMTPSEFLALSEEEKFSTGMENGGVKATEATSSIVHHLLDKGYLEKFVNELDLTM